MVAHELRIIVEKVSVSSQEVVKRDTLKIYDIINSENILDLGLRHAEQICLLEKIQNALLAQQAVLMEEHKKVCPVCGEKLKKNGYRSSSFDHQLRIQKNGAKKQVEKILGWFHIGKKFENVRGGLGEAFEEFLDSAKWELWHGHGAEAWEKLNLFKDRLPDEKKKSQLQGLDDYLQRNQDYLVNYESRKRTNQIYTSQVAQSPIDSRINARHKRSGKMQWSREGAHQVLQIRAMMASREWESPWQEPVLEALGAVA